MQIVEVGSCIFHILGVLRAIYEGLMHSVIVLGFVCI